jgi:hypothetical protein
MSSLPPLKTDPKYGYFARWPEEGDAWLHPDDVALARTLIPSMRVFRRDGASGEFGLFHYGELTFRARPTLWQEVEPEGFELGDWVEVRTRGLANDPRTGTISEMLWDDGAVRIVYQITVGDQPLEARYSSDDLKHVDPTQRLD